MDLNFDMLNDLGASPEQSMAPVNLPINEFSPGGMEGDDDGGKSIFNFDALQENLNIEVLEPEFINKKMEK